MASRQVVDDAGRLPPEKVNVDLMGLLVDVASDLDLVVGVAARDKPTSTVGVCGSSLNN